MKKIFILLLVVLICPYIKAQRLTTGFFSGINLSDIHDNKYLGKWKFKPGPVQGFFADFDILKPLGFRTGLEYSTLYYEHKLASQVPLYYYEYFSERYTDIAVPSFYNEEMDLSFITVPLQLRLTIPSKPDLKLSAGIYYSFLTDQNPDHVATFKSDFGYIWSAGISYPFSEDFSGLFNVRYLTGEKTITSSYKNGSFDFTIGVAFNGFLTANDKQIRTLKDTSESKIRLQYFAGFNINRTNDENSATSPSQGLSAGVRIDLPVSKAVSFCTGLSFEQKGYSFKDSSDYSFATVNKDNARLRTNTRVTIDYIELPAQLRFYIGSSKRMFFSTGPWLAFRLNARCTGTQYSVQKYSDSYQLLKTTVYDDITGFIKGTDKGWSFAAGFDIHLKNNRRVEAGVEYKHGFRDVYEGFTSSSSAYNTAPPEIVNRSVSFHLGFIIPGRRN